MISLMHLAGRQLLPNVLASLAFRRGGHLQREVVLHSASKGESARPAMQLSKLLGRAVPALDIKLKLHEVEETLQDVRETALGLMDEFPESRWVLHVTGGNKMMSAGLIQLAIDPRVQAVIYLDIRHGWRRVVATPAWREAVIEPSDPLLGCLVDESTALDLLPLQDTVQAQFAHDEVVHRVESRPLKQPPIDPLAWLEHVARSNAHGFAGYSQWKEVGGSDGAAFEYWIATILHLAGATQVAWGCTGHDVRGNIVFETDVIANCRNQVAFYDIKIERSGASGKSEQIRSARQTAERLGGLSARAVMVRPNWPTSQIQLFARSVGVDLITRDDVPKLVDRLVTPLGLPPSSKSAGSLAGVQSLLERLHRQRGKSLFTHH